ncbi:MAG: hypothetical protein E6Q36_05280 [Chryseobacterium sp.]|nr:MAG: hypothetical protein E6Q36_05280 [Chryseobacterium sp.]
MSEITDGRYTEKEVTGQDIVAKIIEPTYTYDAYIVALDGHEEYTIDRKIATWSISHARTLLLVKDENESLIMTAKSWKTAEIVRSDFQEDEATDLTNKRRVDTDEGNSDYFDFIQIDNESGIIQGINGTPESPRRIVTYNPQYFDFLIVKNN